MHIDYGGFNMDITTYTMILVTKLWGLSWAFRDGCINPFELSEHQRKKRVMYLPTILEYCSFVFFCCGCLVAPFMDFSDYKEWIEMDGVYKDMPRGLKNGYKSFKPALIRFC